MRHISLVEAYQLFRIAIILNQPINDAAVISVNDVIYVAGGRNSAWGPYFNQVWRLEY